MRSSSRSASRVEQAALLDGVARCDRAGSRPGRARAARTGRWRGRASRRRGRRAGPRRGRTGRWTPAVVVGSAHRRRSPGTARARRCDGSWSGPSSSDDPQLLVRDEEQQPQQLGLDRGDRRGRPAPGRPLRAARTASSVMRTPPCTSPSGCRRHRPPPGRDRPPRRCVERLEERPLVDAGPTGQELQVRVADDRIGDAPERSAGPRRRAGPCRPRRPDVARFGRSGRSGTPRSAAASGSPRARGRAISRMTSSGSLPSGSRTTPTSVSRRPSRRPAISPISAFELASPRTSRRPARPGRRRRRARSAARSA